MKIFNRIFCLAVLLLMQTVAFGQQKSSSIEVDYNNPRKYIVGGISVEGNKGFHNDKILQQTGLRKGMEVTIPGEDISSIVNRLWMQRYFQDVAVYADSLSASKDTIFLKLVVKERPRVTRWTFTGVKSGEKKDLQERLNFKRGGEYSDYVAKTSVDIIKRYYKDKGFLDVRVEPRVQKDTIIGNAIRVNYDVDRGPRIKIKTINFIGNDHVSDYKLAKSMKKTKSAKFYNFFSSKKFNDKEYKNDKKSLISAFNEAGYRDARLLRDSIYTVKPGRLGIDFVFDEGDKYYFRNITWTGNSVYTSEALNSILQIQKGDVYDVVTMEKRLQGGGKQGDIDVSKLYRDNGYLFFNVQPVELNVVGDSVDVEMRIAEGKQATLNNIIINGNDLTNERVVRRQVFTRPGYLFSQSDFERSIREIASLGQFDPEAITDPAKGYSIIPDQLNSTVDIVYNVTEKPSSQLELSGGWGRTYIRRHRGCKFQQLLHQTYVRQERMEACSAWRCTEPFVQIPDERYILFIAFRKFRGTMAVRQEAYVIEPVSLL